MAIVKEDERISGPLKWFNLKWWIRSLHLKPFFVTFRYFLRVPQAELYHPIHDHHSAYPDVSLRYRGLLGMDMDACIGCRKCERICPNKTIIMVGREFEIKGKKREFRFPAYFAGRCLKCGLCEEVCPNDTIRHTDIFENAGYRRDELFYTPERLHEMFKVHIQPKIDAGIAHRQIPDKRRHPEEFQKYKETEELEEYKPLKI